MSEYAERDPKPSDKKAKMIDQYKDSELIERSGLMTSVRSLGSRIRSGIMGISLKQGRQQAQPRRSAVINHNDQ